MFLSEQTIHVSWLSGQRFSFFLLELSWKLASCNYFNRDETCFCNYKGSLFIGLIFVEYLLYVRHSPRSKENGEESGKSLDFTYL